MNTLDKCKNCGGEYGIHHYQTDQCPVGGREASVNQKQEYKTTTFEKEDDSAATIAALREALADMTDAYYQETGMGEHWQKDVEKLRRVVNARALLEPA